MKTKTLILLLIVLVILAGAGSLIVRMNKSRTSGERLGSRLFENLPANDVVSIRLTGPDGSVSLARRSGKWVVEDRFDYPADFTRIADLVRTLKEAKIGRRFQSSEETLSRLSLRNPMSSDAPTVEKAILIQFKEEKGTVVASVLLGKAREEEPNKGIPNGRYVMREQESEVYLIDKQLDGYSDEPTAWLNKTLVNVDAGEVMRISCLSAEGKKTRYAFERPGKGTDFAPIDFIPDSKINKSALKRLAGALSPLRLEDVVDPAHNPKSLGHEGSVFLEYRLFNGMIYRVYPDRASSEEGPRYCKLEVDFSEPAPSQDREPQASTEKPEAGETIKVSTEEVAAEAKRLNQLLGAWVYVIPSRQFSAFVTDPHQLLEKQEKSKAKKAG